MSQASLVQDLPRLGFQDAIDAYQWSEERRSRPVAARSSLLRHGRAGVSEHSVWDFLALADTIAVALDSVGDRRAKAAFRATHGNANTLLWESLGAVVADLLEKHLEGQRKSREQLEAIGRVAVAASRYRARYDATLSRSHYAHALGIKRQSLDYGGWKALIETAELALSEWTKRAYDELDASLRAKGIL